MKTKICIWTCVSSFFVGILSVGLIGPIVPSVAPDKSFFQAQQCFSEPEGQKEQCLKRIVEETVKTSGVDHALELLAFLYDKEPSFANPCHDIAHKIGQLTYKLFASQKDFTVNPKAAYCSFGFYHGFMETLLTTGGTVREAQAFCTYVDKQLGTITPNARLACYHGIGHGATDVHNSQYFGNEEAMIKPALELCEKFSQTTEQLKLCATGVFDSVSIGYYNKYNGLTMKKDDPLWLCRKQPDRYKQACYRDMMPALFWFANYDFKNALELVVMYVENQHQAIAMELVADTSIRFIINKTDPKDYIPLCRSIPTNLQNFCIRGLASGIFQYGEPEVEYKQATEFCRSSDFSEAERFSCYESVLSYAQGRYGETRYASICETIAPQYQDICRRK